MEDQIDFFLRKLFKLIQLLQTLPPNVFLITHLTMDIKKFTIKQNSHSEFLPMTI